MGPAGAELVAELEQTATDMDPAVARVCSQLAGIWLALQRLRAEKPKHTMDDLHHYQNVRPHTLSYCPTGVYR